MPVIVERFVRTLLKKINLWFRPFIFRWFVLPWFEELADKCGRVGPMQFFEKEIEKVVGLAK